METEERRKMRERGERREMKCREERQGETKGA